MSPADALVIFGVTGDLAFKKIFPALARLIEKRRLAVPIIGVARGGWELEELRARGVREPGARRHLRPPRPRRAVREAVVRVR